MFNEPVEAYTYSVVTLNKFFLATLIVGAEGNSVPNRHSTTTVATLCHCDSRISTFEVIVNDFNIHYNLKTYSKDFTFWIAIRNCKYIQTTVFRRWHTHRPTNWLISLLELISFNQKMNLKTYILLLCLSGMV